MPISRGREISISKRSPIERHSSGFESVRRQAIRNGSGAGLDFPDVSRPIISGIRSEIPIASRVFRAGRTGLFVTQIILNFSLSFEIVSISFSSRLRNFEG